MNTFFAPRAWLFSGLCALPLSFLGYLAAPAQPTSPTQPQQRILNNPHPCIAFSAHGFQHDVGGPQEDNIFFTHIDSNVGNAFDGSDFTAPTSGSYFFTWAMVRSGEQIAGIDYTDDDTYMWLNIGTVPNHQVLPAWAGEHKFGNNNEALRMTGTSSTVIFLNAGDKVIWSSMADGATNQNHRLYHYQASGFLLCAQ